MSRIIKKEILTAIIYARVSSKEQVDNFSLETQEKTCRNYAEKNNLQVLKLFREEGESAKTADRTELRNLLEYCRKRQGKIGKLIVYKIDRLARNNEDYYALRVILKRYGVTIQSATENIKDDPQGKFMEAMLSAIAEFDNNVRAEKTSDGMRTRLSRGLWGWGAPLGYKNKEDVLGTKIIVQDQEKAPFIKKLFEDYAKGTFSLRDLVKRLRKDSLRTKHNKKVSPQLIGRILRNPLYYGRIELPRWEISVKGSHEPIISEDLFRKVQQLLRGGGKTRMLKNRDNPHFPLRGVRCGGCGRSISGGWSKGRNGHYAYYGCFYKECPKRKAIQKPILESDFTLFLKKLTLEEKYSEAIKETIRFSYKQETLATTQENKRSEDKVKDLRSKKTGLIELKTRGMISDTDFIEHRNMIDDQIKELELSYSISSFKDFDIEHATNFSFQYLKTLPEQWKDLPVSELRVLRTLIFPKNVSYNYPGFQTAELMPIYALKAECGTENECYLVPMGFEPM